MSEFATSNKRTWQWVTRGFTKNCFYWNWAVFFISTDLGIPAPDAQSMTYFCSLNDLTSLICQPTYYKNSNKATCADLVLTNYPNFFQQNNVYETGLSYFHGCNRIKNGISKTETVQCGLPWL